jgi:hypothetical protein
MQRPPVLDLQQPSQAPAGKVGASGQGEMPSLWRRIHTDDGQERPYGARQVQEEGHQLARLEAGITEKGGKLASRLAIFSTTFPTTLNSTHHSYDLREAAMVAQGALPNATFLTLSFFFFFLAHVQIGMGFCACRTHGADFLVHHGGCIYYVWGFCN